MPRKHTPGPKSRTQKHFANRSSEEEADNSESFGEPELEGEYTDYNLDYSSASPLISRRTQPPKTIPAKEQIQRESTASTSRASTHNLPVDRNAKEQVQRKSTASTSRASVGLNPHTSTRNPPIANKNKRKQRTPVQRERRMWKLIRDYQNRTENLTPKVPFGRIIREILMKYSTEATRITGTALEALQVSAELYMTQLFSDAYFCTLHRGRVTLSVNDIRLVRFFRGPTDTGNA